MKLFTVLLAFGAAALAKERIKVPGENPLTYCESHTERDILTVKNVDLDPNPPQKGKNLTITASGTLSKKIEDGAYALISVKVGVITLLKLTSNICDEAKKVGRECPIEEGPIDFETTVTLPDAIPPAKFLVHADVYTVDNEGITCMEAVDISFKSNQATGLLGEEL